MRKICERCQTPCDLCTANDLWNIEYWICPKCDSTYVLEEHRAPKSVDCKTGHTPEDL